ncbi:hypothetical protein [Streptomyces sp. NPDC051211]|uniref:hypothetical protein n=1 Tax=Streptomyces sp. NPDC051211 TaxID=3154643 RepID=UPI00344D0C8A
MALASSSTTLARAPALSGRKAGVAEEAVGGRSAAFHRSRARCRSTAGFLGSWTTALTNASTNFSRGTLPPRFSLIVDLL